MSTRVTNLYPLRLQKGITQEELSRRTGISQANLSKIEKEKQDPTLSTFLKICEALGIRPAEVLEGSSSEPVFRLSNARVKKIARGILDSRTKLSEPEKEIAELLKQALPGFQKKPVAAKKRQLAEFELSRRLPENGVEILSKQIEEERARQKAQAERDYQIFLRKMGKIWGKRK
ncbi:MAG: helix-turn-helix transcriptional regulator [Candidatus Omnitrophica bacterium]|nr:helix-turn-helix transcriptional regulator [Candidatus Omnitrophota bacterium]